MKQWKAKIGSVIDLPVHALRSVVIDAGLMRAMRYQASREASYEDKVA